METVESNESTETVETSDEIQKIGVKLLNMIQSIGIKTPSIKQFLHDMFKNRKIEDLVKKLIKIHPWFIDFSTIYQHLTQSQSSLDFIQFVEEDESIDAINRKMFIHWVCTNFPHFFPLMWSIDENDDLSIETWDKQSILLPKSIKIDALCKQLKKIVEKGCTTSIHTQSLTFELYSDLDNRWTFFIQDEKHNKKLSISINTKTLIDFIESPPVEPID